MNFKTKYIVKVSGDKCRGKFGTYKKLAVLEVYNDISAQDISMISTRCKNILRIIIYKDGLSVGKTNRGAFQKALAEAEKLCLELNTPVL